mgnify:CR=1 FL=1
MADEVDGLRERERRGREDEAGGNGDEGTHDESIVCRGGGGGGGGGRGVRGRATDVRTRRARYILGTPRNQAAFAGSLEPAARAVRSPPDVARS